MYRTIVVGVTNRQTALVATEHALQVARASDADVHLVYAIDRVGSPSGTTARRHAEGLLDALSLARPQSIEVHVVADRPDRAILDVAAHAGADLIVIGNQGVAGANRVSSAPAARVIRGARCSVLLVDTNAVPDIPELVRESDAKD